MKENPNVYKRLRESTETDKKPALTQGELAEVFEKEGNPLTQSVISKLETSTKEPPTKSFEVIKAYSEHFKVTSDYLLGLRDIPTVNENVVMIYKYTGLNEKSIETLKILKRSEYIDVLNFIMSDYSVFGRFLSNLHLYFDNEYDTPVHFDEEKGIFVESAEISNSPILSTNGERYLSIGKRMNEDICGQPAYGTISVPVSILESHALHCIQAQIDDWKRNYNNKGSD